MPIVLASASPRRAELLRAAGIDFEVIAAHIDETAHPHEAADAYVRRIAEEKGRAVAPRVGDRIVLAADTTVVVDEMMLAKPEDDADATRMLRMLSGRTHEVLTAVSVWHGKQMFTEIERTDVEFAPLSEFEIDWYVATGEPRDKAGAYAIQGYASRFVTRIDGSYSNVVGLPVALVYDILKGLTTL
ncbi:MAG: septum formation inhibitor Maf [Acidobacteria bacterium]|nr:MAG: septum formation inhibitor Maf [Acidobacteriota bacterium]